MIITRTPYRVSFFGGGTDYPAWYLEHGGAVLATTINKYCYITCRALPPFFEHHSRIAYSRIETVKKNEDIEHPSVRACLRFLGIGDGVEIHHDGDLPARTGLGTSSSFTVGLLHALYTLTRHTRDKQALAADAIEVESRLVGETVGCQDQTLAAHGGFRHVQFHPEGISVDPVVAPPERLARLEQSLLLFFTGFSRTASSIAADQVARVGDNRRLLDQTAALVPEGLEILRNPARNLDDFGYLLHHGWELKRALSPLISTPAIDEIYLRARAAGALGGKLLGAGGGGFILLYVPPERQAAFGDKLRDLLWVPFRFSRQGSQVLVDEPEESYEPRLSAHRHALYATSHI